MFCESFGVSVSALVHVCRAPHIIFGCGSAVAVHGVESIESSQLVRQGSKDVDRRGRGRAEDGDDQERMRVKSLRGLQPGSWNDGILLCTFLCSPNVVIAD